MSLRRTTSKTVFITAPRTVEVRTQELRTPAENEVLIEAIASGISAGTEMNVYRGNAPQWRRKQDPATRLFVTTDEPEWRYPLAYGYACVGRILHAGAQVKHVSEGEVVFAYAPHSSHALVDEKKVVPLRGLNDPILGVFLANLSTAYNGVLDARPPLGANLVVSGLGVIGQLLIRLLSQCGLRTLIGVDVLDARRELARQSGADYVLDPQRNAVAEEVRELTDGRGADIVIEVSGAATALNEAIRTAGYNGTVIAMSWYSGGFDNLDLSGEFHHNRVQVCSSQVGGINPSLGPLWTLERRTGQAVDMLDDLGLEALITHRLPVEQASQAYTLVDRSPEEVMQVALIYEESR